jgi:hypothetical protein
MKKTIKFFVLSLTLILITAPAYADAGVPMLFVTFPMMVIGLIPIILIEALLLIRRLGIDFKRIIWVSSFSNMVSTLVGIPLTWLILVILQMFTGGGGVVGAQSPFLRYFLAVTWQAPWLIPYESQLYWMVPTAATLLLVPFFFASWLIEAFIAKIMIKDIEKRIINKAVFVANLLSYAILLFLAIIWLVVSIALKK